MSNSFDQDQDQHCQNFSFKIFFQKLYQSVKQFGTRSGPTLSKLFFQNNLSGTLSECQTVLIQIRTDTLTNFFFQNILSGTLSECQTVWNQIRTDTLSKLFFSKHSFRNSIRVSNSFDQDQDRHSVKIIFFKTFFQEHYQRVKQFGTRSGPTLCQNYFF